MALGQTVATYGNWTLLRCLLLDFKQTPVKDSLSQTDLIYHRFTVRVLGYIHGFPGWNQIQEPFTTDDGTGQTFNSASLNFIGMRVNLPPRQKFLLRIGADDTGLSGGYLALYAEPAPERPIGITHMDVNNGPECEEFVIRRVVRDNVFEVEATFIVCKVECQVNATVLPSSGENVQTAGTVSTSKITGILSNRWSISDNIDANLKTTRTYRGRLRTSTANLDPNQFRYFVVPPLAGGMRRELVDFVTTPDGLNLDYTLTDVEVAYSAPYPAKKMTVQHTESVDQALVARSAVDVVLSGARDVDKGKLITIAMNIVQSKALGSVPNQGETKHYMESLSITDYMGDDQVISVSARIRRFSPQGGKKKDALLSWRIAAGTIGQVLTPEMINTPTDVDDTYDSDTSFGGRAGDSPYYQGPVGLIGMFLPYLQSPCNDTHKIVDDGETLPPDENAPPIAEPRLTVTAKVDANLTESDDDLYSTSEQSAMYTQWKMESIYKDKSMKLALPIAASTLYGESYQTTRIVTLSRPQSRRIVRAEAERLGQWPEMPSASQLEYIVGSTSGMTQTYLGRKRRFATPFYTAGGQKAYRIGIDYYFALSKPASDADTLPVGRTMWTSDGNIVTSSYATNGWS